MVPKKEDGEFEVNLVTHRDPGSKPNTSEIPCARPSKSREAWRSWRTILTHAYLTWPKCLLTLSLRVFCSCLFQTQRCFRDVHTKSWLLDVHGVLCVRNYVLENSLTGNRRCWHSAECVVTGGHLSNNTELCRYKRVGDGRGWSGHFRFCIIKT